MNIAKKARCLKVYSKELSSTGLFYSRLYGFVLYRCKLNQRIINRNYAVNVVFFFVYFNPQIFL